MEAVTGRRVFSFFIVWMLVTVTFGVIMFGTCAEAKMPQGWKMTQIDDQNGGDLKSVMDGNGKIHVIYTSSDTTELFYANNTSGAWVVELLSSTIYAFNGLSIAIDSNGKVHIAYSEVIIVFSGNPFPIAHLRTVLNYANNVDGQWDIQTIYDPGSSYVVGDYTTIAFFPSNVPQIFFHNASNDMLVWADHRAGGWFISPVDNGGEYVTSASYENLNFSSGIKEYFSEIVYYDKSTKALKQVEFINQNVQGITIIDDSSDVGKFVSITADNEGFLYTTYYDSILKQLKMAVGWERSWVTESIPAQGGLPLGPSSISVGNDMHVSIAYLDRNPASGGTTKIQFIERTGGLWVKSEVHSFSAYINAVNITLFKSDTNAAEIIFNDPLSNKVIDKKAAYLPDAPEDLTAIEWDKSVKLTWSAPYDGGDPMTSYTVFRKTQTTDWVTIATLPATQLQYNDTGLTNGLTYNYRIMGFNGYGGAFTEINATPAATPFPPMNVVAVKGIASVTLSWSAPSYDGGTSLLNYSIWRKVGNGSYSALVELSNSTLSYVDSGLTNGLTYYYKVSAVNRIGQGTSAEVSAIPSTVPGKPILNLKGSNSGEVTINWTISTDGGSSLTKYTIWRGADSNSMVKLYEITDPSIMSYKDVDVKSGEKLAYAVTATNSEGTSETSNIVEVTVPTDYGWLILVALMGMVVFVLAAIYFLKVRKS